MSALSVIIPASNEAALLPACLAACLASDDPGLPVEVIVAANGCRDATAEVARGHAARAEARGWSLRVIDDPVGGKTRALNAVDAVAAGPLRAYLDADVTVSPPLLAGLARALATPAPAYASGQVRITARGAASRLYARAWRRVPFMAGGVPGCGLFAVNAAGRARWGAWPDVISDDTFARLHFTSEERRLVPHPYDWPVAEGFSALVRVRRRQDRGVAEIARRFPHLLANADPRPGGSTALHLALADPLGLMAYGAVALATRARAGGPEWSRGR